MKHLLLCGDRDRKVYEELTYVLSYQTQQFAIAFKLEKRCGETAEVDITSLG
jgi:hypothetical protein